MKQVEKKKKLTEEAFMKATEAETTYKSCVIEANKTQAELEKAKVCSLLLIVNTKQEVGCNVMFVWIRIGLMATAVMGMHTIVFIILS